MLHRRGARVRGEVVHLAAREHPVDDVRRCGRDVDGDVAPSQAGDDDERHGGGDDEREDRGGEEPADPAADEPQPGDGSGGLELDDEESGDEEARDDEEDVDTDEATAQREPGVVGEDGEDRDGAKPLDVRPEPRSGGASRVSHRSRASAGCRRPSPPAVGRSARRRARRQPSARFLAASASRTSSGTRPVTSPPKRATSFTSELETCSSAGSPGRKTVSIPLR